MNAWSRSSGIGSQTWQSPSGNRAHRHWPGWRSLSPDQQVHQARLEVGPGVDAVATALFHVLPHRLRPADLAGAGEPRGIVRAFGGMFLERPDQPGELLPVLAEPGMVRNHHQGVLRMEDAGGLHERIDHQRRGGHERADEVLEHLPHDRVLDVVLEPLGGVLVEGPDRVAAAVLPGEVEGDGLPEAAGPQRRQAASDGGEVEDRDLDGRGPEVPVVVAVEPALRRAGPEPLSGDNQVRLRSRRRDRPVNPGALGGWILLSGHGDRNREGERERDRAALRVRSRAHPVLPAAQRTRRSTAPSSPVAW